MGQVIVFCGLPFSLVSWLLFLLLADPFESGLQALSRNDLPAAQSHLEAATKLHPTDPRPWLALAQTYWKLHRTPDADTAAARASTLIHDPSLYPALALYYSETNNTSKTAEVVHLAIQQTQYSEDYYFRLADLCLKQQNFPVAIEALAAGRKIFDKSPQLELASGVAYYGMRRFPEAIDAFLRTIQLDPSIEQPYVFLGRMFDQAEDRLPRVRDAFAAYAKRAPGSYLALFLNAKADPAQAEALLRKSIALNETFWESHFDLGVLLDRQSRFEDAAREMRRAGELNPTDPVPKYRLARIGKSTQPQAQMPSAVPAAIRYIDIAESIGIRIPNTYGNRTKTTSILDETGNGVAIFDFDGDGANDVFIANGNGAIPQLYRNDGKGHFTDVSRQAGFTAEGWAQGVCVGDYDNDGHPDLLVTYYGHNILYRNLGNGRFENVTAKAGLPTTGIRYGSGCAFLDYDRDGSLDLFISNYVGPGLKSGTCPWMGLSVACGPIGLPTAFNILYHNNGDGTFTDVSERAGILKPGGRYGLGVAAADFDNDGWPDIYVACDQTPSLLYHNRHDGTFEERGVEAGVAFNADGQLQSGMGVAIADFDGNGFLDIAKTNFSGDLPSLYKNEDGKFFTDVALASGLSANHLLGWGVAFLDADEDGWPDLVIANGHVYPEVDHSPLSERYAQKTLLYRNLGGGRFTDITATAGQAFNELRPARGLATGDLDGDGRPEIVIVNMNQVPSVLKNVAPQGNAIAITLTGVRSNRSAIGARCIVEAGGRRQIAEVMSGGSYYSQNSFTLYFGLGQSERADQIEVRWPSGAVQKWQRVAGNRTIAITEGRDEFNVISWTGPAR